MLKLKAKTIVWTKTPTFAVDVGHIGDVYVATFSYRTMAKGQSTEKPYQLTVNLTGKRYHVASVERCKTLAQKLLDDIVDSLAYDGEAQ